MGLFRRRYGIVPACDVEDLPALARLVRETCDLGFVQGYKIGMGLVVRYRLKEVTAAIRRYSNLPIVYDHQKFGTDIPDICGGQVLDLLKAGGVDALIIFPQSGVETLKASVTGCAKVGLVPIVGGEMTHHGYTVSEGGYIADAAPERMYADASRLGVDHFVVPGTRLESMERYKCELSRIVDEPKFLFPGIGRGQGGDIVEAFRRVAPLPSYAIVGRGIYAERDHSGAAKRLWEGVAAAGLA